MADVPNPKKRDTKSSGMPAGIPKVIDIDATTLTVIIVALLLIPLLITGFTSG